MTGATGNVYCGLHEFADMGFLLHLLQPGDLFIDIGANVGTYTILSSKICGAHTLAFEPDPETADALCANVAANELNDLVRLIRVALGNTSGDISFTRGRGPENRIAGTEDREVRTVPVRTLDGICRNDSPTMLKLDVEGFEHDVILGAERVLGTPSLLAVQSELETREIAARLRSYGFERCYYNPFSRELTSSAAEVPASNALFIRSRDAVMRRVAAAPQRDIIGVMV